MWQVTVFCSGCSEESEVTVADLDEIEREVCDCGYNVIVLSGANFEPLTLMLQPA